MANKTINGKMIEHIARLARLNLTKEEIIQFSSDLDAILNAFKVLDTADAENIEPSFQPIEIKNIWREDKIERGLTQKEALANTRHKEKGFFKGPRVV